MSGAPTKAEMARAHHAVAVAIKRGLLSRGGACEVCGATGPRIEAHHDDYSRPLSVRWLCVKHHIAEHKDTPRGRAAWKLKKTGGSA